MRASSCSSASSSTFSAHSSTHESGCRTMDAPRRSRLDKWFPRPSIVGRIFYPLFEERRTLAGRMSWIGLGILVAFLVVAVGANIIAPFDPSALVDEKKIAPRR